MVFQIIFAFILSLVSAKYLNQNTEESNDLKQIERLVAFDPLEDYLAADRYYQDLEHEDLDEDALTNLRTTSHRISSKDEEKKVDELQQFLNHTVDINTPYYQSSFWQVIAEGRDTFTESQIKEMRKR